MTVDGSCSNREATAMINWNYFPRSKPCPPPLEAVVAAFDAVAKSIDSEVQDDLPSNAVLAYVAPGLEALGYHVERGKAAKDKVFVPVFFGQNGTVVKRFEADAWNHDQRIVIEVEAGRGVVNNQFLKDLFQACMMDQIDYLVIAVRNIYGKNGKDFYTVSTFMDALYASGRLELPLAGVLIIGY